MALMVLVGGAVAWSAGSAPADALAPADAVAIAEPLAPAVKACRSDADEARRLRCYDAAVDRLDAAVPRVSSPAGAEPLPSVPRSPAAAQSSAATQSSGAAQSSAGAQSPAAASPPRSSGSLPMFHARIVEMRFRRAGEFIITLDNGQVWTQFVTEGRPRIGVGDTVLIRPGFMGAYILKGPTDWTTKVHPLGNDPDS